MSATTNSIPADLMAPNLWPSCTCHDRAAQEVAHLVTQGWDQWEASLLVYSGEVALPVPPTWDAPAPMWSSWVAGHVAAVFAPLRRAVGIR